MDIFSKGEIGMVLSFRGKDRLYAHFLLFLSKPTTHGERGRPLHAKHPHYATRKLFFLSRRRFFFFLSLRVWSSTGRTILNFATSGNKPWLMDGRHPADHLKTQNWGQTMLKMVRRE
ncbi:hypothetical protein TNCT_262101 [Trichonephila clavata]|uniref:Uncharacterized protein n=1 Tax=Trichonephila clavata TaxID=2740835 RepID=A0A8X6HC96_TRICU|nr:hypothetical protein TNCT_262101 [Trichonephila clavata]